MKRNVKASIIGAVLALAAGTASISAMPAGAAAAAPKLVATVGPGYTISLRTSTGVRVRSLKAGAYSISVRDRSDEHNFHLSGPGVNKSTSVDDLETKTWRVRILRGKTYRFVCDPHAAMMRGSFRGR